VASSPAFAVAARFFFLTATPVIAFFRCGTALGAAAAFGAVVSLGASSAATPRDEVGGALAAATTLVLLSVPHSVESENARTNAFEVKWESSLSSAFLQASSSASWRSRTESRNWTSSPSSGRNWFARPSRSSHTFCFAPCGVHQFSRQSSGGSNTRFAAIF
jgi:hypothetical protein